ncbi:MAG TPA: sigma-E factor negative regulatory protein [Steroidobacteraceae bacterium]|nr:sigma-E factor negative regulatory protein [Steroidobacteraceae bacterium]HRX89923.1 sigma-E factor negative regulatory protein [Steroidobacteraceae bacterium]
MSGADVNSEEINLQRDSQLSAMYDDELPAAECELLARRLARDAALRKQWGRYALIGAALRSDRSVRLDDGVPRRVAGAIAGDAPEAAVEPLADAAMRHAAGSQHVAAARGAALTRWLRPAAGVGIAASVAAAAIFLLRAEAPMQTTEPQVAAAAVSAPASLVADASDPVQIGQPSAAAVELRDNGEPVRYVTPQVNASVSSALVPSAQLANYVVAHSEVSGPLSRRIVLSGLVASDAAVDTAGAEDVDASR